MTNDLRRYEPRTIEAVPVQKEHDLVQADDILQFARVGWRRKWLILSCLLVALGLGPRITCSCPYNQASACRAEATTEFGHGPHASCSDDMSTI